MSRRLLSRFIGCAAVLLSCAAGRSWAADPAAGEIEVARFASGFVNPVAIGFAPGEVGRMYVAERAGKIVLVEDGRISKGPPFLDLSTAPTALIKRELIGLTFHPRYIANGKLYVSYARHASTGISLVVSEFVLGKGKSEVDPETEKELLDIRQLKDSYIAGPLAFDADKMLLVGVSDGGAMTDPEGHGQNRKTFLGTILRLNVEEGDPYIPPMDNPFVMSDAGLREIFAYGFRNPWKISVDRETGDVWAADRGNDAFEEVNLVEAGKNYGWSVYEGSLCLRMRFECQGSSYVLPIASYPHSQGSSITGGYVYRGTALSSLKGTYVYADAGNGKLFGLRRQEDAAPSVTELLDTELDIVTFGEDENGELYLADGKEGKVYQVRPRQKSAS